MAKVEIGVKMRKHIVVVSVAIVVITCVVLFALLNFLPQTTEPSFTPVINIAPGLDINHPPHDWHVVNTYDLFLSMDGYGNYTIYLPITINKNRTVADVMSNLNITGNATHEIIDTEYGKALKIESNEDVHIYGNISYSASEVEYSPVLSDSDDWNEQFPNNFTGFSLWQNIDDGNTSDSYVGDVWIYLEKESSINDIVVDLKLYRWRLDDYLVGGGDIDAVQTSLESHGWQRYSVMRQFFIT